MTLATITIASHHFVVTNASAGVKAACHEFSRPLIQYKRVILGRGRPPVIQPDRVFAGVTSTRSEFRYHINQLEEFKKLLYRHHLDGAGMIEWKTLPTFEGAKASGLVVKPHIYPFPDQIKAMDYINDPSRAHSKVLIMQPGDGKTLTTMLTAQQRGERICIMLEPRYIEQWLEAFEKDCLIPKKRIVVIRGGEALKLLLNMAYDGELPYDAIIVSTTTFRNYIEFYKNNEHLLEDEGYCIPPQQFFQHIRAGMRVIDEVHENFHFMYLLDLYTHIGNSISLSATLMADDPFLNSMMQVAYPMLKRFDTGNIRRYVTTYSLHYSMRRPKEIRTLQPGMGSYSHAEFEKSIMKSKEKTQAYFHMVRESMRYTYDLHYQEGDRCLVYFTSIDMCTLFKEYIGNEYPHLDVRRYVADDPLENLLEADVSSSTVKSAGTGKDIPRLTTVILTPAINSSSSNIQGFGRIRDLNRKDPSLGRKMYFVYFVCDDFVKHIEYHERKKELLRNRALSYEPRYYGTMI